MEDIASPTLARLIPRIWQGKQCCIILGVHNDEGKWLSMRPLAISPETAVKLAEALQVPLERLMHMPQHILLQKMMELAKEEAEKKEAGE